jgi:transcriptional regulator with XRE-family HTH domain
MRTPVTTRTTPDASEMVELLRYARYVRVAEALGVSRNVVSQWAKGRSVTPYRLQQVRELLTGQHKEAAPPDWAERLERKLDVLVATAGVDPVDVQDEAEAQRLIAAALARLGQHEPEAVEP